MREVYVRPEVIRIGSVASLTLAGSGSTAPIKPPKTKGPKK